MKQKTAKKNDITGAKKIVVRIVVYSASSWSSLRFFVRPRRQDVSCGRLGWAPVVTDRGRNTGSRNLFETGSRLSGLGSECIKVFSVVHLQAASEDVLTTNFSEEKN